MLAMYGNTWASQYGTSPAGIAADTWSAVLSGLTPQQVAAGLKACALSGAEFPPNAPRFRALCFGLPDFAAVNHEILCSKDAERTPFARLVWSFIDGYQHRIAPARDAERMRRAAYDQACDHVMQGGALPESAAAAIEHQASPQPQGIPNSREGRIEHLREMLGDGFSEVAANATSEDQVRRHHEQQARAEAEQELIA